VTLPRNRILVGDARRVLAELPAASVDCVITSPPYFQLRDYGVPGQIGLERSVGDWVDELRLVARGLARVLRLNGSLWLNLGDTYARRESFGSPRKSLLLAPERLLLALTADGWIVRNKIIWAKTNPMPHSVTDRLSNSHEVIYFLTRQPSYFFNLDAIRVPHRSRARGRPGSGYPPPGVTPPLTRDPRGGNRGLVSLKARGMVGHPLGRNPGDVWTLAAANFRGAHFATFPPALIERPLLAACPERGIVLDPFFGSGTVGLVAERHRRDWLGIELNPTFARQAEKRIAADRITRADGPSVDATKQVVSAAQPSTSPKGATHA
jgi:site-specific DNA-methyltransferase (adenine-specific)